MNPRGAPPKSFFAYIARQYGKKLEDVVTDAFVYLILTRQGIRHAIEDLLARRFACMPGALAGLRAVPRKRGEEGDIPDVRFVDERRDCRIVFESKLWSGLTQRQPVSYLRQLRSEGDLLLFIVPDSGRQYYWRSIKAKCEEESVHLRDTGPFSGNTEGGIRRRVSVASWEELIGHLEGAAAGGDREASVLLTEMKEVCGVAEREKIEPLSASETCDQQVARRVGDYMALAVRIAAESEPNFHCDEWTKRNTGVEGNNGWWGRYGKIEGYRAWIGLDTLLWGTHKDTPIWLEFDEPAEIEEVTQLFREWQERGECHLREDERRLVFPIKLKLGALEGEIVEEAIGQLRRIACVLRGEETSRLR